MLGSLSADGNSITGEWADVPRGATANSGTIVLSIIDDAVGRRLERVSGQTTGGFGGSVWLPTGSSLGPQNIVWLAGQVQRYDKRLIDLASASHHLVERGHPDSTVTGENPERAARRRLAPIR